MLFSLFLAVASIARDGFAFLSWAVAYPEKIARDGLLVTLVKK